METSRVESASRGFKNKVHDNTDMAWGFVGFMMLVALLLTVYLIRRYRAEKLKEKKDSREQDKRRKTGLQTRSATSNKRKI
ncbi:MAG: hypothetical protein HQL65_08915 [Magnetococcales bacterium]|nr:hypothetical protein [Magnetococcales bacterium]